MEIGRLDQFDVGVNTSRTNRAAASSGTHRRPVPVRRKRPNRPPVDNALRASWRPPNGVRFIQLARTDVLLLDDWGMTGPDSQTRADLLEIIDDRAANKATIITSQLPIEHWHAWVGDATIADAILDRLMQKHHRFTLTGDSLRQKPKTIKKDPNTQTS